MLIAQMILWNPTKTMEVITAIIIGDKNKK